MNILRRPVHLCIRRLKTAPLARALAAASCLSNPLPLGSRMNLAAALHTFPPDYHQGKVARCLIFNFFTFIPSQKRPMPIESRYPHTKGGNLDFRAAASWATGGPFLHVKSSLPKETTTKTKQKSCTGQKRRVLSFLFRALANALSHLSSTHSRTFLPT